MPDSQRVRDLLTLAGGCRSLSDSAVLLGVSEAQIIQWIHQGRVLCVRKGAAAEYAIPVWQMDSANRRLDERVQEILRILAKQPLMDATGKMVFFLSSRDALGGRSVLDLVREGGASLGRAIEMAKAYCD